MHLTRQNVRELPSFIGSPQFDPERGLCLTGSMSMPIHRDGERVTDFVPDWQLQGVSLLFYPIVILQFRHLDERSAFWLLDRQLRYLGSAISELPPATRAAFARRVASIAVFLSATGAETIPYRMPDDVTSFLRLAPDMRRDILSSFGHTVAADIPDRFLPTPQMAGKSFFSEVETDAEGSHRYAGPDRGCELLADGKPIVLEPGWRIPRLSSLFFPIFVADLHHDDGRTAYWFFDGQGGFITDSWGRLPEPTRSVLAAYGATILEDLWQDVVAHPGRGTRDHVEAFLELPVATRKIIFDFMHSPPDPEARTVTWAMTDAEPEALAYVAQTERGAALLDRACLRKTLTRYVQDQNIALANEETITWPSPIDGRELPASGFALLIDNLCFAYRVQDLDIGFTFYIIAFEWHFRTFGLYLPENDLLVTRDGEHLASLLGYEANYRLNFLRHAVQFGDAVLAGSRQPPGKLYHTFRGHSAMHIGHFVWQDLSGIDHFLAAVKPERIPQFLVPESYLKPEIYGPIDEIFPILRGKVVRTDDMFSAMIPTLYREHSRVIKATSTYVRRAVGAAILRGYKDLPAWRKLVSRRRKIRGGSSIVVLLGLRVGNRTIPDIEFVGRHLISAICESFPAATVIIDGQNASPDAMYASVGDDAAAPDSFLRRETDIARALTKHAAAHGCRIINNIGRPVAESLLWCEIADFFVAPWGAALAKYRWICNKPGLVLAGRWNLQNLHELAIYHGADTNEAPAEMWFNSPQAVEDLVDDDEADVETFKRCNFRIDVQAVQEQLVGLLKERC